MATRDFRLRVATGGSDTVSGSVDFTADTLSASISLADPIPTVGGAVLEPLEARASSVTFAAIVQDTGGTLTVHLSDAGGRWDLLQRLIDWSVSSDGGGSWTVIYTGHIHTVTQPEPTHYRLEIGDEGFRERETQVFTREDLEDATFPHTASTQIWPPGVRFDENRYRVPARFGGGPSIRLRGHFEVDNITAGGIVELVATKPPGRELSPTPQSAVGVVTDDVIPEPLGGQGNFTHLRFRHVTGTGSRPLAGTDYEVEGFASRANIGAGVTFDPAAKLDEDPNHLRAPNIVHDGTGLSEGDIIFGFLYGPTRPPDQRTPIHVGHDSTDATWHYDPMLFIKDLYDFKDVRYNPDVFSAYDSSSNPEGLIDHPFIGGLIDWRIRIRKVWNLRELTRRIYALFGLVPLMDDQGRIAPKRVMMPASDLVSDVSALFEFDESNTAGEVPSWEYGEGQVTRVVARWEAEREAASRESLQSLDRIAVTEQEEPHDHDRLAQFTLREHVLEGIGVHTREASRTMEGLATEILHRMGDGPVWTELSAMETVEDGSGRTPRDVGRGDWVIVDHETRPNPATGSRGGNRLAQVMDRREGFGELRFLVLEAGPDDNPPTGASLSITTETGNTKHGVTITISGLDADTTEWDLQLAINDTQPATGSPLWRAAGTFPSGTTEVDVSNLPSGETIWARATELAENKVRSGWTTAVSQTLDGYSAPTGFTEEAVTPTTIDVSWTNSHDEPDIEMLVDSDRDVVLPPGSTQWTFVGLDPGTAYTLEVRYIDQKEGTSSSASLSSTTSSGTETVSSAEDSDEKEGSTSGGGGSSGAGPLGTGVGVA